MWQFKLCVDMMCWLFNGTVLEMGPSTSIREGIIEIYDSKFCTSAVLKTVTILNLAIFTYLIWCKIVSDRQTGKE